MENLTLFKDFINEYPVSKTLRFSLIPQGYTLEHIKADGIIGRDEQRAENYKKVKNLLDEYYRDFIDACLSNLELDEDDLFFYDELYKIKKKNDIELQDFEEVQIRLRHAVAQCFKDNDKFEDLFNKNVIEKDLVEYLEKKGRKDDIELALSFKGYTTMFRKFWSIRENLFSDEEKASSIAYRIINENLPRFVSNKLAYEKMLKSNVSLISEVSELNNVMEAKYNINGIHRIFDLDYFVSTLTQKGITLYNAVIGGLYLDNKTKVKGYNEAIYIYNQQHKDSKLPLLKQLYKQLLSDEQTLSYFSEGFKSDEDVINAISAFKKKFEKAFLEENNNSIRCFESIDSYIIDDIHISNSRISDLSKVAFGYWGHILDCMYEQYKRDNKGKVTEKYIAKMEKHFKKIESFSVKYIEECTDIKIGEAVALRFKELLAEAKDACKNIESWISTKDSNNSKRISSDENAVMLIKSLLDSMKRIELFTKIFSGTGHEPNRDASYYEDYDMLCSVFEEFDSLYNKIRNHLTKKPYSKEKCKLSFDMGSLLSGWHVNMEKSNAGIILRKNGLYYLGIMKKDCRRIFEDVPEAETDDVYEKLVYMQLNNISAQMPRICFAKANIEMYEPSEEVKRIRKEGTFKKGKNFSLDDCHTLIDFYKSCIEKTSSWNVYNFEYKETSLYNDIGEFFNDIQRQAYKISFRNIEATYIDNLTESGQLYLFQIYNKDFSPNSKGKENLHTMYWKALFSEENIKNPVYILNGNAEVFYRRASISEDEKIVHPANVAIKNKNANSKNKEAIYKYDIVKNKRYTVDKFQFNVPITINFKATERKSDLNIRMREQIKKTEDMHIMGINRGEKNLLYVSIIDMEGNIVLQESFNTIKSESKEDISETNYYKLLSDRAAGRQKARQEWNTIESIKTLKAGYLSQVIHKITSLMVEYNAIIAMEDLDTNFKQGRQKIEKQVYQQFEKALIDKLNCYIDKGLEADEPGGLYKPLQLTKKFESFKKMGKQTGAIFYVPAWHTSNVDPTTGFISLIYPKYENKGKAKDFISKIKSIDIVNDNCGRYYAFDLDFKDFTDKGEGTKTDWTICSYGKRSEFKKDKNGKAFMEHLDLTAAFDELFNEYNVDKNDIKNSILKDIDDVAFYKKFMNLFKLMLQIINYDSYDSEDIIQSPVKNQNGEFFYSGNVIGNEAPICTSANGAYNIARKALWIVNQIKALPENQQRKVKLAMTNKEWMNYIQG